MKKWLYLLSLTSLPLWANPEWVDSVKRMKWNDLDVVWIQDEKFPKYTWSLVFKDGALSDTKGLEGQTHFALEYLTAGTKKYSQNELNEFFEFYGVSTKTTVTHEYSTLSVTGLVKDAGITMQRVCHLLDEANYPAAEVKSLLAREQSKLKSLVTSHAALADRVFRQESLQKTPFDNPAEGNLKSIQKLNSDHFLARLQELKFAPKTLYITGPKDVLSLEKEIEKCGWKVDASKISKAPQVPVSPKVGKIILVPVPDANQAQIRLGRYLTQDEFKGKNDLYHFVSSYLGGGFTSKLVQEIRVKRGLTYSAGAYASIQGLYGRAGIVTFSKNETVVETLNVIKSILSDIKNKGIEKKEFDHQLGHLVGGYAFQFEQTEAFLSQVFIYDHQGRPLSDLANFPDKIRSMTAADLAQGTDELFNWERQFIVVVGNKSLAKELKKIAPVEIVDHKKYL